MTHNCDKGAEFEDIKSRIKIVKADLDEHREAQQKQDHDRLIRRTAQEKHDRLVDEKLNTIIQQISVMSPTVEQLQEIERAGIIGKKIINFIVWFIFVIGVVFGGIFGLKEWIKR